MTGDYTFLAPETQNELTRRIQQKLAEAGNKKEETTTEPPSAPRTPPAPKGPPSLGEVEPATLAVQ